MSEDNNEWETYVDNESGMIYYVNRSTNVKLWGPRATWLLRSKRPLSRNILSKQLQKTAAAHTRQPTPPYLFRKNITRKNSKKKNRLLQRGKSSIESSVKTLRIENSTENKIMSRLQKINTRRSGRNTRLRKQMKRSSARSKKLKRNRIQVNIDERKVSDKIQMEELLHKISVGCRTDQEHQEIIDKINKRIQQEKFERELKLDREKRAIHLEFQRELSELRKFEQDVVDSDVNNSGMTTYLHKKHTLKQQNTGNKLEIIQRNLRVIDNNENIQNCVSVERSIFSKSWLNLSERNRVVATQQFLRRVIEQIIHRGTMAKNKSGSIGRIYGMHISEVSDFFRSADRSLSGTISTEEFISLLKQSNPSLSLPEIYFIALNCQSCHANMTSKEIFDSDINWKALVENMEKHYNRTEIQKVDELADLFEFEMMLQKDSKYNIYTCKPTNQDKISKQTDKWGQLSQQTRDRAAQEFLLRAMEICPDATLYGRPIASPNDFFLAAQVNRLPHGGGKQIISRNELCAALRRVALDRKSIGNSSLNNGLGLSMSQIRSLVGSIDANKDNLINWVNLLDKLKIQMTRHPEKAMELANVYELELQLHEEGLSTGHIDSWKIGGKTISSKTISPYLTLRRASNGIIVGLPSLASKGNSQNINRTKQRVKRLQYKMKQRQKEREHRRLREESDPILKRAKQRVANRHLSRQLKQKRMEVKNPFMKHMRHAERNALGYSDNESSSDIDDNEDSSKKISPTNWDAKTYRLHKEERLREAMRKRQMQNKSGKSIQWDKHGRVIVPKDIVNDTASGDMSLKQQSKYHLKNLQTKLKKNEITSAKLFAALDRKTYIQYSDLCKALEILAVYVNKSEIRTFMNLQFGASFKKNKHITKVNVSHSMKQNGKIQNNFEVEWKVLRNTLFPHLSKSLLEDQIPSMLKKPSEPNRPIGEQIKYIRDILDTYGVTPPIFLGMLRQRGGKETFNFSDIQRVFLSLEIKYSNSECRSLVQKLSNSGESITWSKLKSIFFIPHVDSINAEANKRAIIQISKRKELERQASLKLVELREILRKRDIADSTLFIFMDADRSNAISFGEFERGLGLAGIYIEPLALCHTVFQCISGKDNLVSWGELRDALYKGGGGKQWGRGRTHVENNERTSHLHKSNKNNDMRTHKSKVHRHKHVKDIIDTINSIIKKRQLDPYDLFSTIDRGTFGGFMSKNDFISGVSRLNVNNIDVVNHEQIMDLFWFLSGKNQRISITRLFEAFFSNTGYSSLNKPEIVKTKEKKRKKKRKKKHVDIVHMSELIMKLDNSMLMKQITPESFMIQLEPDSKEGINLLEFRTGILDILGLKKFTKSDCRDLFNILDHNHKGTLQLKELLAVQSGAWKEYELFSKTHHREKLSIDIMKGKTAKEIEQLQEAEEVVKAVEIKMSHYDTDKEFRVFCNDIYGGRDAYLEHIKRVICHDVHKKRNATVPKNRKGLDNQKGENNCFLNVVIQALWHLDAWREGFLKYNDEKDHQDDHGKDNSVLCALKNVFANLKGSSEGLVSSSGLRKSLAKAFSEFKEGDMSDASEAHLQILTLLHSNLGGIADDHVNTKCSCLVHKIFGQRFRENYELTKKGRNDWNKRMIEISEDADNGIERTEAQKTYDVPPIPKLSETLLHYSWVNPLVEGKSQNPSANFDDLLCQATKDVRVLGGCEYDLVNQLLQPPPIFTIGLVWASAREPKTVVNKLLDSIDPWIDLSKLGYKESRGAKLKGMYCFYISHYMAIFKDSVSGVWLRLDDAVVAEIGNDWNSVLQSCRANTYQPSVLFYETQSIDCPIPKNRS